MRKWGKDIKTTKDEISSSKWVSYFEKLFYSNGGTSNHSSIYPVFNELDFAIKREEISTAIRSLKKNKSPGLDNILNEFLIAGKDILLDPLCNLFNTVFSSSTYPDLWSLNYLRPIHKKGDKKDPDNYRGIAVGSCLGKLYSYVLLNRLEKFIEKNQLVKHNQIGFMKNSQTSDHMFVLKTLVDKFVKDRKERLYVAFVDFKKAYDTINRGKLFQKLKQAQLGDLFLKSLKAMYSSVKYCIKMTNGFTDPIKSFKGLKQGCVLSPTLFNIFIDDVESIFTENCDPVRLSDKDLNHLLYADDLILISKSPEGLQNCLNHLDEYCQLWDLNVNIAKSKTMIFNSSGRVLQNHTFLYRKKELELVQSFTYLGITFSSNASFKKAYQTLGDKACKAMHPLVDAIFKFNLTVPKALDLFEKLVQPILLYGSEVWASFSSHQLNSISKNPDALLRYSLESPVNRPKLKFCKQILGLKRNSIIQVVLKYYYNNIYRYISSIIYYNKRNTSSISFLDVQVSMREGGVLSTDLFCKSTDTHQYLHKKSCHPWHTKKAIPYGQALRFRRICSEDRQFQERVGELAGWLKDRGYEESLVNEQIDRVRRLDRANL